MSPYEWLGVCLACCAVGFGLGYWLAARQAARRIEEVHDRYARILEPVRRVPGTPTNLDGEPSKVTRGNIRNRRRWYLQG